METPHEYRPIQSSLFFCFLFCFADPTVRASETLQPMTANPKMLLPFTE